MWRVKRERGRGWGEAKREKDGVRGDSREGVLGDGREREKGVRARDREGVEEVRGEENE